MLLAIDTSTQSIGLSLYNDAQVVAEEIWQAHERHTVELAPAIQDMLRRSALKISQIEVLAVALGPGSFTGLRIGLAVAKGLALALHIPIIGIPSMDALVAVLQAGRGRLAVVWYATMMGRWSAQGEPRVTTASELSASIRKPSLVIGELTTEERQILARKRVNVLLASPAQSLRRPSYLAELAWRRWQANDVDDIIPLSPIYLHVAGVIPA